MLSARPEAVLVDVRTDAEWSTVGVPDTSASGNRTLFLEWLTLPLGRQNPAFSESLTRAVPDKATPLFFMCKAGGRSAAAAAHAAALGYSACYNLADGFEGTGSATSGWKAALPWRVK